jgi:AAA family ATPase
MTFKNLSLRGPKRSFIVNFVNGKPTGLGQYHEASAIQISSKADNFPPAEINGSPPQLEVIDIAGIDQALTKLNRFLRKFDREFKFTKAQRSCAVLLHGGHGTGKTFLLDRVIRTGWAKNIIRIEDDARPATIRTAFKKANLDQPSIIVIDELESIVSKDDTLSKSIAKTLGEELDNLTPSPGAKSLPRVLVIAATLDPSSIPMSLKRRGRFQTEIQLPIPDAAARKAILNYLEPQIHPDVRDEMVTKLGDRTHAYTAEDLATLLDAAYDLAEERVPVDEMIASEKNYFLSQEDIEEALLLVRPTAMHDITLQPPRVRWDDIGGQDSLKKALQRAVETPLLVSFLQTAARRQLIYFSILSE